MSGDNHNKRCEKCSGFPEDYIQLNCEHNFCLPCLLVMDSKNVQVPEDEDTYLCEITCHLCQEQTLLDQPSTQALISTLNQIINQNPHLGDE